MRLRRADGGYEEVIQVGQKKHPASAASSHEPTEGPSSVPVDYYKSPHWTSFRDAILNARGFRCEHCGATGREARLELHHKHYRSLWEETPDDVELCCDVCHAKAHGRTRKHHPKGTWKGTARNRPPWLSDYARIWREEMGGEPHWGKLCAFLRPLDQLYGVEKVARAFRIYLRDAGKYASIPRFAQTIKVWLPTQGERWCVNHPQFGMYGIRNGEPLCLECWQDGGDAA